VFVAAADGTEASEGSSPLVLEKEEVEEEGDGEVEEGGSGDNTSTENMVSLLLIVKLSRDESCINFDNFSVLNQDVAEEEQSNMDVAAAGSASTPARHQALDVLQSLVNSTSKYQHHKSTPSSASAVAAATSPVNSDSNLIMDEEEVVSVNRTCIIHMDSLGMHSTPAVGKALRRLIICSLFVVLKLFKTFSKPLLLFSYLRFEWEARKKAELDAELDALLQSDVNKEMSEEEVEKMKKVNTIYGSAFAF